MSENDLGDLVILKHATCFDLYKNYLPPESVDYMKVVRSQMAIAQAQHDNMVGERRGMMGRGMMMARGGRGQQEGDIFEVRLPLIHGRGRGNWPDGQRLLDMVEQFEDDSLSDSGKIHGIT